MDYPFAVFTRILNFATHVLGFVFGRFQSSKSGKIYLHNDIRLLFSRKSIEVDTGIPYELKSFTEVPRNPKYSPRVWPRPDPLTLPSANAAPPVLPKRGGRETDGLLENDGHETWWDLMRLDETCHMQTRQLHIQHGVSDGKGSAPMRLFSRIIARTPEPNIAFLVSSIVWEHLKHEN